MRPLPAALLAAVYVAAHAWLAMAVLMTTAGMRVAAAPGEVPARVWTGRSVRLMLMVVIFGVDYLPRTIMRLAMSGVCRP